jgi:predicted O-methyltransferase YrrM
MHSRFELAKKYFKYYFKASSAKGHGVHSPFVFNFIRFILNDRNLYPEYRKVEMVRHHLVQNKFVLKVEDLGAGSAVTTFQKRSIGQIARYTSKPRKYAQLLFRLTHYYQPKVTIELGTSLGISTAYMSLGYPEGKVITLEGAKQVSQVAGNIFKQLKLENVELIHGNFDDTLPALLNTLERIDMVFIDGNHRKEPTLRYFEMLLTKINKDSVVIIDDIRWSEEMEEAWQAIKNHPSVRVTVDLFFMGVVFFKEDFKVKQHFIIRY